MMFVLERFLDMQIPGRANTAHIPPPWVTCPTTTLRLHVQFGTGLPTTTHQRALAPETHSLVGS